MDRLRDRIIGLVIFSVVTAIAGSVLIAAEAFFRDKQAYVMELASISAPNIASAFGRQFDFAEKQFHVIDRLLAASERGAQPPPADLLQAAFASLESIDRLEILDRQGQLLAELKAPGAGDRAAPVPAAADFPQPGAPARLALARSGKDPARTLAVLEAALGSRVFLAVLRPEHFSAYLEPSRALSATWVADDGAPVLSSPGKREDAGREKEVIARMLEVLHGQGSPSTIAKELELKDGTIYVAAVSPIPGSRGSAIVTMVPSQQASALARQVIRTLIPFTIVILLLLVGAGIAFSVSIVKPIEALTQATAGIARGNWKVDLTVPRSSREIKGLVRSFRKMALELEAREKALTRAHENLRRSERLASLGQFSAGLAHEIKNPLNAVLGFAQVMEKKLPPGNETFARNLKFILDETRRANRIISDLLTFARQKPPALVEVSVAETIRRSCEMFAPLAQSQQVAFRFKPGDPEAKALIDRDQLHQVLQNLFNNSIQAIQEMEKEKAGEGSREIEILAARAGDDYVITVRDTGPGIAPENLKRIFEPFFSTKGAGKGTGLGLPLCNGIVEQHRGRIEVESEPGSGTTFRITLPLA